MKTLTQVGVITMRSMSAQELFNVTGFSFLCHLKKTLESLLKVKHSIFSCERRSKYPSLYTDCCLMTAVWFSGAAVYIYHAQPLETSPKSTDSVWKIKEKRLWDRSGNPAASRLIPEQGKRYSASGCSVSSRVPGTLDRVRFTGAAFCQRISSVS